MLDKILRVPVDRLKEYPGNARRGDVSAIARSLDVNGQFQPLVVQKSTEHILIGNHTWKAAKSLEWSHVDVVYVDVDDNRARKIVLAANRTADLATYDLEPLAELLGLVDDLDGTGYTQEDLAGLLDMGDDSEGPLGGDREKPIQWGVVIYCKDEEEQLHLMELLLEEGHDVRAL